MNNSGESFVAASTRLEQGAGNAGVDGAQQVPLLDTLRVFGFLRKIFEKNLEFLCATPTQISPVLPLTARAVRFFVTEYAHESPSA